MMLGLHAELRPGDHLSGEDFTHAKPGFSKLRKLLWTPDFLKLHPVGRSRKQPGVFQLLWRHMCTNLSLADDLHQAYARGSIAWGTLDTLGDGRTGIATAKLDADVSILLVPRAVAGAFRDVTWTQLKRQVAVLYKREAEENRPEVAEKIKEVREEVVASLDAMHRSQLGAPLPGYNPSSDRPAPLRPPRKRKRDADKKPRLTAAEKFPPKASEESLCTRCGATSSKRRWHFRQTPAGGKVIVCQKCVEKDSNKMRKERANLPVVDPLARPKRQKLSSAKGGTIDKA
ncbi:unnamed protein product [Zymoseptoria tritici ST99CH_1A5]|uniref:Uncharacterized protein n=1 Tax=Zymoseptoria tritici ST99CH_1A5 TaxID=1276529 RepID=A0A1Y6LWZ2_ZYMTR|nr:unnamed protein product [Zymoseptoria tritici ST99CH_1A5]